MNKSELLSGKIKYAAYDPEERRHYLASAEYQPIDEVGMSRQAIEDRCAYCVDNAQAHAELFRPVVISRDAHPGTDLMELNDQEARQVYFQQLEHGDTSEDEETEAGTEFALSEGSLHLAGLLAAIDSAERELQLTDRLIETEEEDHRTRLEQTGNKGKRYKENQRWSQRKQELLDLKSARETLLETHLLQLVRSIFWKRDGLTRFQMQLQELKEFGRFLNQERIQTRIRQSGEAVLAAAAEVLSEERLTEYVNKAAGVVRELPYRDWEMIAYKQGTNNLRSRMQAEPLSQIALAAFGEEERRTEFDQELENLAKQTLTKYESDLTRLYHHQEENPISAYLYDLALAAFLIDDADLIFEASSHMIDVINRNQDKLWTEMERLDADFAVQVQEKMEEVERVRQQEGCEDMADERVVKHFSPFNSETPHLVSTSYDRLAGLEVLFVFLNQVRTLQGKEPIRDIFAEGRERAAKEWAAADKSPEEALQDTKELLEMQNFGFEWRTLVMKYYPQALSADVLISRWREQESYTQAKQRLASSRLMESREGIRRVLRNFDDFVSLNDERIKQGLFEDLRLLSLFLEGESMPLGEILALEGETEERMRRAFRENRWFVAEWGDRFTAESDSDLDQLGVEHMTFYPLNQQNQDKIGRRWPDKKHLLFYQLELRLNELPAKQGTMTLFFNELGELFYESGEKVVQPKWVEEPLKSLISKRIEFVTRGPEELRETEGGGEAAAEPKLTRRAHWRRLGPPYTLSSDSAKDHAQEVKDRFGVDIYERILWLRAKGVLGEDEVETFVRATELKRKSPNILVYQEQSNLTKD